jgi:hypothetical protein
MEKTRSNMRDSTKTGLAVCLSVFKHQNFSNTFGTFFRALNKKLCNPPIKLFVL